MEGDYNVDEENEGDESSGVNAENEAEKSSGVNAENEVEEDIGVSKRKTKLTARKRVFRDESEEFEVDLRSDWSDEEFADFRKIREEVRMEHEMLEREKSQFIKDSLEGYRVTNEELLREIDNNSMLLTVRKNLRMRTLLMQNLTCPLKKGIRRNPNWKLSEMQEEFKRVLKVEVCDAKCCSVRKRALSGIAEEMVKHYAGLMRFGGEILRSNKENTVKISTTRMNEQDSPCFQRFYVCYAELRKGWKEGCRPILGLDGCFLKTVCGGQLLSAVGRDGNNSIFPIAMAVVETESYDSWEWFLMLVIEDLGLGTGYGYTFISDQQKGLIKAVKELLPHIEHGNCTRHTYSNLGKKHGSEAVRNAFFDASDATHPEAFKAVMRDLEKASKRAWVIMNRFEPQKSRLNPTDFVSHYFKKETYMKAYSHCLEVIKGEPFWEEVDGDTIMPPPRMKTLRGRPKRQRRREGWEGSVNRGENSKLSKLSRQGRVMHCSNCKKLGNNITKCPEETQRTPSTKKQRGKKKKKTQEEEEIASEMDDIEKETGEDELMEEAMRNEEMFLSQKPNTPRRSQRLAQSTQSTLEDATPSTQVNRLIFMPTPGLVYNGGTSGTPDADMPGTSRVRKGKKSKGPVKSFKAPRKK
ncbi:hypothetical protein AgCh_014400 [Apium graveolens]